MTEEEKIDPAEMRTAVGTCIKDPHLQQLFKSAPDGAREVIKLSFYSTVFPEKMDAHRFRVNLRAIEPDLTPEDLRYLIDSENDPWLKSRFCELLEATQDGDSAARKLHVRRAEGNGKSVDLNAEALKRNIELNELEKKENAEREASVRRKVRRTALLKSVAIGAVVLVALAGGAVWLNRRNVRQREAAAVAREADKRQRAQEAAARAEQDRERAARKKRKAEERAAEEARFAAERAKRTAEQEKRRQEAAERTRLEEEKSLKLKDVAKRIDRISSAFDGARLLPWSALPRAQRPGAVEGTFLCLVPDAQGACSHYEVKSQANGVLTIVRLTQGAEEELENFEAWNRRLASFGGFIHDGSFAYLFLPKSANDESPYPREDMVPSRVRLGELANVVRMKDMSLERVSFEVSLYVPRVMKATAVATVKFDETVPYEKVREKVHGIAATKVKKQKPKKVRRTVVMYDGSITKRQINGVTLLPRNPTRRTAQYENLLAEAERQEEECLAAEREAVERYDELVDKKTDEMLSSALFSVALRVQGD